MTTNPVESPYWKARDLAQHLNVSLDELYTKVQKGEIPVAFRWGPDLRFNLEDVMAALTRKEQP